MCYSFLTILLGTRTHLPVDAIGILIGIGALSSTIGAFVGGALSDRFGRGRLMLLSRSEEHTSELQSQSNLVCRLLLEKNNTHVPDPLDRAVLLDQRCRYGLHPQQHLFLSLAGALP